MLSHLLIAKQVKQSPGAPGSDANENTFRAEIDSLHAMSRSGLWGLLIFLAASAMAYHFRGYSLSGSVPASLMEQLGPTPDVILINIVLGVSTFCSLVIIAGRIYNDIRPSKTWTHLCFRIFFYLLYFMIGAVNDYFNVVFISGLVVIALQHYNVWNYYSRAIETRMNKWDDLHTCGKGLSR